MTAEAAFLNGRTPAYEDLMKLRYSRMVLEESMRLYPPVWTLARTAVNEDEIGGYRITAGSEILIFPYITQRHPKWWQDPDVFRPERFAPENSAARPRYAYLPFGAGPRTCIGLNFAMTEILVALTLDSAALPHHAGDRSREGAAEPSVTLQPRPGVPVRLEKPTKTSSKNTGLHAHDYYLAVQLKYEITFPESGRWLGFAIVPRFAGSSASVSASWAWIGIGLLLLR